MKKKYFTLLSVTVLSLVSCETERELLRSEPQIIQNNDFFGKKVIKEGTAEYESIVKNAKIFNTHVDIKPAPHAEKSSSTQGEFTVPNDILYGWGIRKANFDKLLSGPTRKAFDRFYDCAYSTLTGNLSNFIPNSHNITIDNRISVVPNVLGPGNSSCKKTFDGFLPYDIYNSNTTNQNNSLYVMDGYMRRVTGMKLSEANEILYRGNTYGTPNDATNLRATGYYLQPGIENNMTINKNLAYKDGQKDNFGVWSDLPLLFNVYKTGDSNNPWEFMDFDRQDENNNNKDYNVFYNRVADKYNDWALRDKTKILAKYKNEEQKLTYRSDTGNAVALYSDLIDNTLGASEIKVKTTITTQDEQMYSITHSGSHSFQVGLNMSYSTSSGVNVGLASTNVSASIGMDFSYTNSRSTDTTSETKKLNTFSKEIEVPVPAGKKYMVEVYSYVKDITISRGANLKVYQKLYHDTPTSGLVMKENTAVPPFVSVALHQGTPLVNIPIRQFARYSGVFPSNGYGSRYLYTGIDFVGGDGVSNKNAYDLLWMGDITVKVHSTAGMRKLIVVKDITNGGKIVSSNGLKIN